MSKPTSPSFASLVQEFFTDYMTRQRSLSPQTVASYRDSFLLLLRFAEQTLGKPATAFELSVLGTTSCVRLHGKGRKQRSLPLWKEAAREIRDWLSLNPQLEAGSALLPRRDGGPMTRANVTQRLKLAVAAATACHPELGKLSVSPHMVRHSTAMGLLQAGTNVTDIALWLGHEGPSTTHMYVEADLAMKERTLARLKPPEVRPTRYRPPKGLMQFLQSL